MIKNISLHLLKVMGYSITSNDDKLRETRVEG